MNDFRKENDLDGSQGDLRALGHPQQPWQAQPWGVQQVPFIFIKMNIWNMFHDRFSQRKRSWWVPRWSDGSRTPSKTSTSSTKASTASTSYVHHDTSISYIQISALQAIFMSNSKKKTVFIWSCSAYIVLGQCSQSLQSCPQGHS